MKDTNGDGVADGKLVVLTGFSGGRTAQLRVTTSANDPCCPTWWAHRDSNPEPKDYESSALTVEL